MTRVFLRPLMLLTALAAYLSASAITWTAIEPGTYSVSAFSSVHWTFTPASDCTIEQKGAPDLNWYSAYTADYSSANVEFTETSTTGYGSANIKYYDVKAGTTYYLYAFAMDDFTVTLSESGGYTFEVMSTSPARGEKLSSSQNKLLMTANSNGIYTSMYATSGSLTSATYLANSEAGASNPIGIDIRDAMVELYDKGMQGGDPITIHVNGLRDGQNNLYNGDGVYSADFYCANPPLTLTGTGSYTDGMDFYSYYPQGDSRAIFTFTFSSDIDAGHKFIYYDEEEVMYTKTGPIMEIGCRSESNACIYYFEGTVNGNTVTFDLTGFNFGNFKGMISSNPVGFKILNLYDLDGQMALGASEMNSGSYPLNFNYIQYSKVSYFTQAWTPSATLRGSSNVSVKVTPSLQDTTGNYDRFYSFEGMKFSYTDASGLSHSTVVPYNEITVSKSGNSTTYTCPIPAGYSTASNVTVNIQGIVSSDGYTYGDSTISNVFNIVSDADILAFEPATGSSITSLSAIYVITSASLEGDYPTIKIGNDSQTPAYIAPATNGRYTISLNPAVSVDGSVGNRVNDGTVVTVTFPANAFFDSATNSYSPETVVTYTMVASASTDPEVGTPFALTSTPGNGTQTDRLSVITVSASGKTLDYNPNSTGAVTLTHNGNNVGFTTSIDNGAVAFTLSSEATEAGDYILSIPAEFFVSHTTDGTASYNTAFTSTITVTAATGRTLNITPDPTQTHTSIKNITITDTDLLSLSYSAGNATLNGEPIVFYSTNYGEATAIFTSEVNLTEEGTYNLYIPVGYFCYNDEKVQHNAVNVTFTIAAESSTEPEQPEAFTVAITGPVAIEEGGSYASSGHGFDDFIFEIDGVADDALLAYFFTSDDPDPDKAWINRGDISKNDNNQWWGSNLNWTLYEGLHYTITVAEFATEKDRQQWENIVRQAEIHFNGTTPAFSYSNVEFVSIDPAPNSTISPADNTIVITWSDPVNVDTTKSGIPMGQGAGIKQFTSAVCNVPGMNYGTQWTLTMDAEYLATVADINLSIYATDEYGKVVRGNMDLNAHDYYAVYYRVDSGADRQDVMVTPAADAQVGKLTEVVISHQSLEVSRDWNTPDNSAYITAPNGDKITFASCELVDNEAGVTELHLLLENPIVADGTYTLTIPAYYVVIGSEYVTYGNNAVESNFTVTVNVRADVDGNGSVDMTDAAIIINMITGITSSEDAADANADNDINISDVATIINVITGVL